MSAVAIPLLTIENYKILPETGPRYQLIEESGVREPWIIAPETPQIEVYLLERDVAAPAASYGAQDKFTSELFPGLTFNAARIFAR